MKTYQDLQAAGDKATFISSAINEHRGSTMYRIAANAEQYDRKRNVTILAYQKLLYTLSGEKLNIDTLCWFDMEESGAYSEVIGNIHDKEE